MKFPSDEEVLGHVYGASVVSAIVPTHSISSFQFRKRDEYLLSWQDLCWILHKGEENEFFSL